VESARLSLRLFTNRYRGGVDSYLQVITAQTATLTNQRVEIAYPETPDGGERAAGEGARWGLGRWPVMTPEK
jgi:hypothetical protein